VLSIVTLYSDYMEHSLFRISLGMQAAALCQRLRVNAKIEEHGGGKGGRGWGQGGNGEGRVVIYTRRAHLLKYYSPIRNRVISLRWKEEWHIDDDHVVFPASVRTAEHVLDTYCGPRCVCVVCVCVCVCVCIYIKYMINISHI
jgi:hypothetical protein